MTTIIRGRCEIICTRPTTDMGSLTGVTIHSGVLGLDRASHGDWLPGARWLLARKQKSQRCKALKITLRGMVKRRIRSYRSIWLSDFVSFRLTVFLTHTPAANLFEKLSVRIVFFIKKSVMVILTLCLFIIHLFIMPVWYTTSSTLHRYHSINSF